LCPVDRTLWLLRLLRSEAPAPYAQALQEAAGACQGAQARTRRLFAARAQCLGAGASSFDDPADAGGDAAEEEEAVSSDGAEDASAFSDDDGEADAAVLPLGALGPGAGRAPEK